jgi:hypothetical protein
MDNASLTAFAQTPWTFTVAQTIAVNNATNNNVTRGLTLSHTTSGTAQNGIGAGLLFQAENAGGQSRPAGAVDGIFSDVTANAEAGSIFVRAVANGSIVNSAAFGASSAAVNYLYVNGSATGQPIELYPQGNDTNTGLAISGKGTGSLAVRAGNGSARITVNNTGIGLFSATPVAQGAAIANATDAGSAITQLNLLLAYLRTRGDIAP